MSNLWYKTQGNSSPDKKQKVYFCAHPKDYDLLDGIAAELHRFQNCAVWYDQEPEDAYDAEEYDDQLAEMQLFVMPVTTNLLTSESRALQHDFAVAQREGIPVLPLMQENGLDELFNEKCGDIQYLDKNIRDITAICYEEKLERFLNSVLVGDEEAKRIYNEFVAYLFLSYRKKDRKYAQKLMRLIHKVDFCRDVAIWYDEFLTPSENFKENISAALERCKIFVLAVTPNLLEADNYVMTTEYPMARKSKKSCLPFELLETDRRKLCQKYRRIPSCINPYNELELYRALKKHLYFITKSQNNSPEHLYYIGLAYLNGVDVEVNHERAIELIRMAAEANCSLAIKKMVSIFLDGKSNKKDLKTAIVWQEKLLDLCRREYMSESQQTSYVQLSDALWGLGELYEQNNDNNKAIECYKELDRIYSHFIPGDEFSIEAVKPKCSIAKLLSKIYDTQSQIQAWQYYSDVVSYISDGYSRKMSDSELSSIANVIESIAISIIHGPHNINSSSSTQGLSTTVKRYRTLLETYNGIKFDGILKDSICHSVGVRQITQFYMESGIINDPNARVNPEIDYAWTNPLFNAEELLFIALGINEYLISTDIVEYACSHNNVFSSIASLWLMMGYTQKAIGTLNLSISFLEKIQSDFRKDFSYNIAKQALKLGRAYINIQDDDSARRALEKTISICEPLYSKEVQYSVLLSDAYLALTEIANCETERKDILKKAAEILCVNNKAYLSAPSIRMSLIRIYAELARYYVNADTWDLSEFYAYFHEAHELCVLCVESDKYECPLYLCKLYNMAIISEDCQTTESMNRVVQKLNVAINNCKLLSNEDSEFSNQAWVLTIDNLLKFDYYVSIKQTRDIADVWHKAFAYLVADAVEFFAEIAENSPLQLLPHTYRHSFSDYALISGGVDGDFINDYSTLLFTFYRIFVTKIHNSKLLDNNVDLREHICEVYDSMIKCQEQGYAFQIFSKEKRELLKLLES